MYLTLDKVDCHCNSRAWFGLAVNEAHLCERSTNGMCRFVWLIGLVAVVFSADSAFAALKEVTTLVGQQWFRPEFEFRVAVSKGSFDDKDLYGVTICGIDHAGKSQLGSILLRLNDINGQPLITAHVAAIADDDPKFKRVDLNVRKTEIEKLDLSSMLEPLGNDPIRNLSPKIDISSVVKHGRELKFKDKRTPPSIILTCEELS